MGCPGAGKGTQTQRLRKAFGIGTISSGDVLRSHVSRQTAVGLKAKAAIESGELVSDALVSELMLTELEHMPRDQSFILDGFPRTVTQAETLDSFMAASDRPLDLVINLDVPWSVILQRIEDRWIHAPSGRTYNISYNPPKRAGRDDVTGEPLTKRADDNVEVFRARLHAYQEQTLPLLGYYSDRGILYSFKGSTSDEIFPQIHSMLCDFFSLPQESADATAASASS
nr:hypothetical protein HK105_002301 [Polyrhizophydium stewartii]